MTLMMLMPVMMLMLMMMLMVSRKRTEHTTDAHLSGSLRLLPGCENHVPDAHVLGVFGRGPPLCVYCIYRENDIIVILLIPAASTLPTPFLSSFFALPIERGDQRIA